MDVRTKADDFEYQYIEVLKEMSKEAIDSYTDIENAIAVTKEEMSEK